MEKFIIFVLIFEFTFSQNIYNAAEYITKNSHKKSKQACAKYVANALIYGGGFKFERQGSAYMYHTNGIMIKMGYKEISNPSYFIKGDITVTIFGLMFKYFAIGFSILVNNGLRL